MTDLTIDRAAQLAEPVRDALPSAGAEQREPAPVRGARTGEVRLTRTTGGRSHSRRMPA